jgi:hypothetical protein
MIFRDMTPCTLVHAYQYFVHTAPINPEDGMQQVQPKHWDLILDIVSSL